jgi:hypothetical protein
MKILWPSSGVVHFSWCPTIVRQSPQTGIELDDADTAGLPVCGQCTRRQDLPRIAFVEDVEHLLGLGESRDVVAARIGSKRRTMARRLHRAGRHDLAVKFDRV